MSLACLEGEQGYGERAFRYSVACDCQVMWMWMLLLVNGNGSRDASPKERFRSCFSDPASSDFALRQLRRRAPRFLLGTCTPTQLQHTELHYSTLLLLAGVIRLGFPRSLLRLPTCELLSRLTTISATIQSFNPATRSQPTTHQHALHASSPATPADDQVPG